MRGRARSRIGSVRTVKELPSSRWILRTGPSSSEVLSRRCANCCCFFLVVSFVLIPFSIGLVLERSAFILDFNFFNSLRVHWLSGHAFFYHFSSFTIFYILTVLVVFFFCFFFPRTVGSLVTGSTGSACNVVMPKSGWRD